MARRGCAVSLTVLASYLGPRYAGTDVYHSNVRSKAELHHAGRSAVAIDGRCQSGESDVNISASSMYPSNIPALENVNFCLETGARDLQADWFRQSTWLSLIRFTIFSDEVDY